MSTSNETRAQRAADALEAYVAAKGEVFEACTDEITDLIADLLHLAARYAAEDSGNVEAYVEKALRCARLHFDVEHENPEEEAA
jgi:hypothetical protein